MRIQSSDIPQADRLESVIATVVAISSGARTDIEIADQVTGIEGDSRQGRYYRKAAEIMGLIENNRNSATLTPNGQIIANSPTLTNPDLIEAVLNLNLYQILLPFIEINPSGVTRVEVETYLHSISNIGIVTIHRRISTILNWLKSLGIIELEDDKYRLVNSFVPNIPTLSLNDIEQPILPTTGSLLEYQTVERRFQSAREFVTVYRNQARVDRAINSHQSLVNIVAERIRNSNSIPRYNQIIDLAASFDENFIFEMKSTTDTNVKAQIRKGISQLYEYRYLENLPDAKLVLVIESQLNTNNAWFQDYTENDRGISLVWDGNNELYGSDLAKRNLPFLELI